MTLFQVIIIFLISLISFFFLIKILFFLISRFLYKFKSEDIRFITVRVPKKDSESDNRNDTIQSMKQNIEVMNQVYKNFYSIHSSNIFDRKFCQNYFWLELLVEKEVIKMIIWVPIEFVETFEKTISSFIPGSVVESVDQPKLLDAWKYASWWYFVMSKDNAFPIKTYDNFEADPMDSLFSAFSRVEWEEKLCLQILASPLDENWQLKLRKVAKKIKEWKSWWFFSFFGKMFEWLSWNSDSKKENDNWYSSSQWEAIEKKSEDEWFNVVVRALAVSPDPKRANKIIWDLWRSFSQYKYIWLNSFVFLKTKNINKFIKEFVNRRFVRPIFTFKKFLFFIKAQILNVRELSSIYHFPHSRFNKNPRIKWQNFKIVPAPDSIPKEWILLWTNVYWWVTKEIRLNHIDRFRHFYIVWQTGTWKSTMLLVQAKQDVQQWKWFCMIDPHWDLCEFVLKNFPKERINDLIYFDAWDFEMPIWFNVFEAETEEEKDIVVNDCVEMFIQIYWPEIFWPRIQDYFRHSALTLMDQPEWWTMVELVRLFVDDAYQTVKVKNVKSPVVRAWWEKTFKNMWQREKQEIIPFYQSKFWPFTTTPIVRNIIWQPKSSFDLFDAMQEKKVILLNLSKWKMWELNSQLLWSMMVTQIKLAALRRARMPESKREDFYLYIDEFQNYITPSIETILSEARKYRLGLVIAHQYIEQLRKKSLWWETDLRPAIFGNVWSQMAYKVWPEDAEYLEKNFAPEYSQTDLVNMDRFKAVMKLSINTQPTRPFSINVTNPYDNPLNSDEKVQTIKEISRRIWGREKKFVENEIYTRVWI